MTAVAERVVSERACPLCATVVDRAARRVGVLAWCDECGLIYRTSVDDLPEVECWTGYIANDLERAYEHLRQPFYRAYWRSLRRFPKTGSRRPAVLDVGCVPGQLLKEAVADGWEAHGVEISAPLCELSERNSKATIWEGHVEMIDFGHKQFDLVVAGNALRHFSRPLDAIRRCVDVLKPGGALVIREIAAEHPRHACRLKNPHSHDMQLVTPHTARAFMEQAGLSRVVIHNSPLSLLTSRRWERLARQAPAVYRTALAGVNGAIGLIDRLTSGRGRPFTPLFVAVGHSDTQDDQAVRERCV